MSPTQARAFYAVANAGSFTAAAKSLNVSQPTVTTQVKALEALYGVELFHRHGRGVSLTGTGRELLAIVRRMYVNQEDAVEYLQAVQGLHTGELRVGSYGPYDVIDLMTGFYGRHPSLNLSLIFANSRQLEDDLRSHHLDVAVFSRFEELPEFHALAFSQSSLVAIVAKSHAWGRRKSIALGELNGQPLICREPGSEARRAFEAAADRVSLEPRNVMEIGSREGVLAAAAHGIGIGLIFDEGLIPEQSVTKLRIRDADIMTQVDVVCLEERRNNRIIGAFFGLAEELRSVQPQRPRRPPRTHAAPG
jgi:aminoethylphosphonate catabolism LysR family transcriptional regulator